MSRKIFQILFSQDRPQSHPGSIQQKRRLVKNQNLVLAFASSLLYNIFIGWGEKRKEKIILAIPTLSCYNNLSNKGRKNYVCLH